MASGWLRGAYRLATRWPEGSVGVAAGGSPQMIFKHSGTLCPPPCTRQRLTVAGSEQSLSTDQDRVATLTIPAELIGWNPLSALPGNLGGNASSRCITDSGKGGGSRLHGCRRSR